MYIDSASSKLVAAQERAVSGKRIMRPSDDVPGTNRGLSLRSAISNNEQFANNVTVSRPLVNTTMNALSDLVTAVRSVRDIAIQAGKPDYTGASSGALVSQLTDILGQMADVANTKHLDQFVFSGTATDTAPLAEQTGGTQPYTYSGNEGVRKTQVLSWVSLSTSIPGSKVFNFDGSAGAGTTDVFTMVTQLRDAIQSGDTATISDQITNIDSNLDNLLGCSAQVGSWAARMDSAKDSLADTNIRLQEMLSDTEDVDLPEAVVQLKAQENVYQVALAISQRMMELSLASMQNL